MKIVEEHPAALTNPEVLQILKERLETPAAGGIGAQQSEKEVLKTLEQRGTVTKSREEISTFVTAIKSELSLTSGEILQLINHAPKDVLVAYLCLEQALNESRLSEDDLDRVVEIVAQHFSQ